MTKINDGLILPFRFYDSLDKQMRFRDCGRYDGDDITHNEYLIMNLCRLLPFQIKRPTNPSETTNLSIVNIHTDVETDLTAFIDSSEWDITTIGEYDYITYYAVRDIMDESRCVIDNCVYYAKFSDGIDTWYSEVFKVIDMDYVETYYREYQKGYRRESSDGDLRIWTQTI